MFKCDKIKLNDYNNWKNTGERGRVTRDLQLVNDMLKKQ